MNTLRFLSLLCAVTFIGPIFAGPTYSIIVNAMESTPFEDSQQELLTENFELEQELTSVKQQITTLQDKLLHLHQTIRDPLQALRTEKFCEGHNLKQIQILNGKLKDLRGQVQRPNPRLKILEKQLKIMGKDVERLITEVKTLAAQSQIPRPLSDKRTGFYKEIKTLIRMPQLSFEGLEGTLSERQQETLRLIFKRSRDKNPPELSSGIALYGPPGNGKTHYAEALSDAAGYLICSIKGGYLNRDYAGDGTSRVMALAQCAREYASKGIIFFVDEFDVMAKSRTDLGGGSAAANMAATMSMLWGIIPQIHQDYRHAIFIAATNRLEDCDIAMTDRFLNRIPFDYSTVEQMDTVRDYHCSKLGSHPTNVTLSREQIDAERNRCDRNLEYRSANNITWPYQSNPSGGEESQKVSNRDIAFLVQKAGEFAYIAAHPTDTQIIITQQDVDMAWGRVLENKKQDSMPSEDEKRRKREIESHAMQQESLSLQYRAQQNQAEQHALQVQSHEDQKTQFEQSHALQVQSHADQLEQFKKSHELQKESLELQRQFPLRNFALQVGSMIANGLAARGIP